MNDLLTQLEAARPTNRTLDSHLNADARDRIEARMNRGRTTKRPAHRRRNILAATAATVAGVAVMPAFVGSDSAAARADLTELAMAAANSEGPAISPGTFLHIKTESIQHNSRVFGDGKTFDTNREEWVRWDGTTWAIDTRPSAGYTDYNFFPRNDHFTPENAAELPANADDLRAYLDRTVSGSNSHNEAIFVAVTDWVRSNLLPPKTLAAALEVLAGVDGVETKDVTVRDRDAVEVSFHRFWLDLISTDSMTIDRATARTISERSSDPTSTYESETTLVEVVGDLPASVRQAYREHKNGERVYDDGHTPTPEEL